MWPCRQRFQLCRAFALMLLRDNSLSAEWVAQPLSTIVSNAKTAMYTEGAEVFRNFDEWSTPKLTAGGWHPVTYKLS